MPRNRLIDGFIIPGGDAGWEGPFPIWGDGRGGNGRPRLSGESNVKLSIRCPEPAARMIDRAAELSGMDRSSFMRAAALEKAAAVVVLNYEMRQRGEGGVERRW